MKLGDILSILPKQDADAVYRTLSEPRSHETRNKLVAVFARNRATLLKRNLLPEYLAYSVLNAMDKLKDN